MLSLSKYACGYGNNRFMQHGFWVYILECKDKSYYVGHTDNLENRLVEHNSGLGGNYTSKRLPVTIVFLERFQTRDEAFMAERQIKGWSRKKKDALIEKNFDRLVELSNMKKS